jgi:coatomer subunit beta'
VINVWSSTSYKPVTQFNYGLKRVWSIHALPESNMLGFGFDEGTVVIKIGNENPIATFNNGKVVWLKSNEVQTFNLKLL